MTDPLQTPPRVKERIGVLLVHGIGEQKRYRHLEDEANALIKALREKAPKGALFKLNVISDAGDVPGAMRCRWPDGDHPAVTVEIEESDGLTEISFREVWWADLGHEVNLRSFVSFLFWATSMWMHPNPQRPDLPGTRRMRWVGPPANDGTQEIKLMDRARLFVLGLLVWLLLPLWGLSRLVRFLKLDFAITATKYLGDVKLYQDDGRPGTTRLEDGGLKPRVAIRKRMICALTQMALDKYDRWYLLGHSLGSVVAFNGLMETEQCLPALLNPSLLEKAVTAELAIDAPSTDREVAEDEYRKMLPPRRAVLGRKLILSRPLLFERLKGIITYGSPLERFRVLWPQIVPVNMEAETGSQALTHARWINIYDPSDAVAPPLESFARQGTETLGAPTNLAYCAGVLPLVSHVRYLTPKRHKLGAVDAIAGWLLNDADIPKASDAIWLTPRSALYYMRWIARFLMWGLLLAVTLCLTVGLIELAWPGADSIESFVCKLIALISSGQAWCQLAIAGLCLTIVGALWVAVAGIVGSWRRKGGD